MQLQSEQVAIAYKCGKMAGLHDVERSWKDLDQTVRRRDERAVKSTIECIDEMVNPFSHDNSELLSISSGVVVMASVSRDLLDVCDRGETQVKDGTFFVSEVPELGCDHEEADTRLAHHSKCAAAQFSNVVISSPDTCHCNTINGITSIPVSSKTPGFLISRRFPAVSGINFVEH
ncbi:UNVERIFIED_CONTAM: hypothetical protein FKN15_042270 [Acipenser sinensis]